MKTFQFIFIAILLSFSNTVFAQLSQEIKGKNNTYIQRNAPSLYIVYNKNNIFTKSTPAYLLYEHPPKVNIGNKQVLDQLVKEYLSYYFKKYEGQYKTTTALNISLFSDINGKIKDVLIAYPREIGILPISVIEDFEQAILNSSIKLEFDTKRREFEGSTWVGQYAPYDPEEIRKEALLDEGFLEPCQ